MAQDTTESTVFYQDKTLTIVSVRSSTTGAEARRSQRMGVYDIYEWRLGDIQNGCAGTHSDAGGTTRSVAG
jgi:hypothetical protein